MNDGILSSNLLQSLWHVAMEPLLILDAKGTVLESNPAARTLLSLLPGISLLDKIEETGLVSDTLKDVFDNQAIRSVDTVHFQAGDANPLELRLQLSPLENGDNQCESTLVSINQKSNALELLEHAARLNGQRVEKLRGNLTSVTKELLEKTLQLAEQKNKVAAIINSMSEGLIGCGSQGQIIHINQAAQNLLLPANDHVIGQSLSALFPDVAKAIGFRDNQSAETMEKKSADIIKEKRDLHISVSPIFDEEKQQSAGFVLIIQDRTEQAELDRMKSDLISIVSHELRSPLTSIKGYVDLMMSGDLGEFPDSMKDYLSIVSSNANRLAALIDDMLDLSRIETGKLNMSFGKVEIKYLCDYVYLTLKPQAEQKKLNFGVEIEDGLSVSGDQERLQQALTNLVSNAIKYTPQGSVTIRAKRNNGEVAIEVADTGLGITSDNQKKLFQKFFRVKTEQTRNIGGTGLGLCITKSIVEAHDGQIRLDSDEGHGSTFTLELPAFHS